MISVCQESTRVGKKSSVLIAKVSQITHQTFLHVRARDVKQQRTVVKPKNFAQLTTFDTTMSRNHRTVCEQKNNTKSEI